MAEPDTQLFEFEDPKPLDAEAIAASAGRRALEVNQEQREREAKSVRADITGGLPEPAAKNRYPSGRGRRTQRPTQPPPYRPPQDTFVTPSREVVDSQLAAGRAAVEKTKPQPKVELPKIKGETVGGLRRRMLAEDPNSLPPHIAATVPRAGISEPTRIVTEADTPREQLAAEEAAAEAAEFKANRAGLEKSGEESQVQPENGADNYHGPLQHT